MDKIIKFATTEEYLVYPQPAQKLVPEWYRKAERFVGGKQGFKPHTVIGTSTIKSCMPFLDALTAGYIIELWQDLEVDYENNEPVLNWRAEPAVAETRRPETLQNLPMGSEYHKETFAWKQPFYIKTPKGYSLLVTHPLNYFDLPFTTTTGIVDSDSVLGNGNLPFLLKKDFKGIIPKGTPIAQIIPLKREEWKSRIDENLIEEYKEHRVSLRRTASSWYKDKIWKRKPYT
jgi:hypothetical protein